MDVFNFSQRWDLQMSEKRTGFCLAGLGFGMGKWHLTDAWLMIRVSSQDYIILPKRWTFVFKKIGKN